MTTPDDTRSRRALLRSGAGALLAALAGCSGAGPSTTPTTAADDATDGDMDGGDGTATSTAATAAGGGWRSAELTDVNSGETFTIGGFEGRPVLLEFFAVWCPVCTKQQRQVGALLDRMDDLVAVSINVDPNEDREAVRDHLEEHGFDWRYAVAPSSMTKALVDEFGSVITSPPSAPVVRLCPGGGAALVEGRGVKSIGDLQAAFEQC